MQRELIYKSFFMRKRGITLIALIITVIILLIIAGTAISISINGGDVFEKTSTARTEYNAKVAEEENSLLDAVDVLDMVVNPDLARHKLTVTVNEDGTIESPYYVNYPSAKGTIKCRVLYNDRTYGLQIVSVNPVTKVRLGQNDPNENVEGEMGTLERAQNSFNRAITTLNEKAEEYMETNDGSILAIDARSVGSDPLDKNYPDYLTGQARSEQMYYAPEELTFMQDYNGICFKSYNAYEPDVHRLYSINARSFDDTTYGNFYYLTSRIVWGNDVYGIYFWIIYCKNDGDLHSFDPIWKVKNTGEIEMANPNQGLRPVFILSPDVKITGGEGTEEVPFEIGL